MSITENPFTPPKITLTQVINDLVKLETELCEKFRMREVIEINKYCAMLCQKYIKTDTKQPEKVCMHCDDDLCAYHSANRGF